MSVWKGEVMLHIHRLVCIIYTQCVGALLLHTLPPVGIYLIPCPKVMLRLSIIMLEGEVNLFLTVL